MGHRIADRTPETRASRVWLALVVLASATLLHAAVAHAAQGLVVRSTNLIDTRTGAVRENVTIVVEGGRVTAVVAGEPLETSTDARVIDGRRRWVTPGFIDVHVHDAAENYLRRMFAMGITSIHLMPNSPPDSPSTLERASQRPENPIPRLQMSKMFTGEFPDNIIPGVYEFLKPKTAEEARQAVREQKRQGFAQIKIIQDDSLLWAGPSALSPRLELVVFDALVKEAHSLDMRVYVHATQRVDTKQAIRAGADAFMHGTFDVPLEEEDLQTMRSLKMGWTPAYAVIRRFLDGAGYANRILAEPGLAAALSVEDLANLKEASAGAAEIPSGRVSRYWQTLGENTRRLQDAGVVVAVGSDGGPAGVETHWEMQLLQERGLTHPEALIAATLGGARTLGIEEQVGSVDVGKLGDFVILEANPLEDIRNARRIEWVVKSGVPFRPGEILSPDLEERPPAVQEGTRRLIP